MPYLVIIIWILFAIIMIVSLPLNIYLIFRLKKARFDDYEKIRRSFVFWGWRFAFYLATREYVDIEDKSLVRLFDKARFLQGTTLFLLPLFIVSVFVNEVVANWDLFRTLICPP